MTDPLHCEIFGSLAVVTGGCGGLICVAVVAPHCKGSARTARYISEVKGTARMAAIEWAGKR